MPSTFQDTTQRLNQALKLYPILQQQWSKSHCHQSEVMTGKAEKQTPNIFAQRNYKSWYSSHKAVFEEL